MCRNIRVLFHFQPPTTDDEVRAAALQYVRKVSGVTRPSRANQAAFDAAVDEVALLTGRLIREGLVPAGPPRTRENEKAKARVRGLKREARAATALDADTVRFHPFERVAGPAEAAFTTWAQVLDRLVPGADVQHVGATAVPGSLSKGDLDVCVRVPAERFAAADAALAAQFVRNAETTHSPTYSSFKDDRATPPLRVQLVVTGAPEDFFVQLRERLAAAPALVAELNTIRKRHDGGNMTAYRAEKSRFYEALLAAPTAPEPGSEPPR